jgi:hypothetical protein
VQRNALQGRVAVQRGCNMECNVTATGSKGRPKIGNPPSRARMREEKGAEAFAGWGRMARDQPFVVSPAGDRARPRLLSADRRAAPSSRPMLCPVTAALTDPQLVTE